MTERPAPADDPTALPMDERVRAGVTDLKARAKVLSSAATALGPLAKPDTYTDLVKLEPVLAKIRKKLESLVPAPKIALGTVDAVEAWTHERKRTLRERLGRELKSACDAAGLAMRVVSREQPVEVRIPPFAVVIDFDRARAELRFAKHPVGSCPADPEAIVAAIGKQKAALDGRFDAGDFFDRCLAAWKAARVVSGSAERVEILDFLPYLAVGVQRPKFKAEPTKANYASYTKAQFAYDVLRLRRQGGLTRNGHRMNLGVATGSSASQKKRVVYLEDEDGNGEYKLTVFFTKEEAPE